MWSTWLAATVRPSIAHCRHRGSSASLCLLIDFQIADLHHERQGGPALRVVCCHEPASIVNAVL